MAIQNAVATEVLNELGGQGLAGMLNDIITAIETTTGTGSFVLDASPAITTPTITTPTITDSLSINVNGTSSALLLRGLGSETKAIRFYGTDTHGGGFYIQQDGTSSDLQIKRSSEFGDSSITVDYTDGYVGIKNASPSEVLDVTGNIKASGNIIASTPVSTTGSVVTVDGTQTLTNKVITKRVNTITSSATPTPNVDTTDIFTITVLEEAAELQEPSGTPVNGQGLIIRILDNGTGRALTYNAIYRAIGVTLPTTTTASKTIYLGFIYNDADTKWDCVAVSEEA